MKTFPFLTLLLFACLAFLPLRLSAAILATNPAWPDSSLADRSYAGPDAEEVLTTPYREFRLRTAIKLNLFQRMGLKLAQKKYKKRFADPVRAQRVRKRAASPNKLGLIGIILGGAGLLFLFIPYLAILSFFLAVAAVVLGAIGLNRDARPGLAIGSIIIGGTLLALMFAALIVTASLF